MLIHYRFVVEIPAEGMYYRPKQIMYGYSISARMYQFPIKGTDDKLINAKYLEKPKK